MDREERGRQREAQAEEVAGEMGDWGEPGAQEPAQVVDQQARREGRGMAGQEPINAADLTPELLAEVAGMSIVEAGIELVIMRGESQDDVVGQGPDHGQ